MAERVSDFVLVQLSARGLELAGEHPLRISNGRRSMVLTPGEATKVERSYEWGGVLSQHRHHDGEALFELAPAAVPAIVSSEAPLKFNIPAAAATSEE